MTDKRHSLQAQYEFLALPALQNGIDRLEEWERLGLAALYVKEVRKRTFHFEGDDDDLHRRAFLLHVMSSFVHGEDVKQVLDFQPRLLATADDLADRPHPIEAVILYATWCEHWLNATLISCGLARGLGEDDVTQMIRDSNIGPKVGWLWRLMGLPPLPNHLRSTIVFLMKVRNDHVHYKWTGHDPGAVTADNSKLKLAIKNMRKVVERIIDFEIDRILGTTIPVADRLFKVSVAPYWKMSALQRPTSAPRLIESDV